MREFNINDWYTVQEATDKLNASRKTKNPVKTDYVRTLARYGKVQVYKIGNASLYLKTDVDGYVVEDRGEKSGRAKKQQALVKGKKEKAVA